MTFTSFTWHFVSRRALYATKKVDNSFSIEVGQI